MVRTTLHSTENLNTILQFNGANAAQKCISMSSDPLEKQFMYKCRIVNPAVTSIYFDL